MGEKVRVLYVDDEPGLLEIARIFIEKSGEFQVETSVSAQEALATYEIQTYDAIIADYQMPGMDGIAFLKVVRERFGDIPFILFTGRGREEVVIQAINNGADFYLQKGGDPQAQFAELEHKVQQSVRRKRAERSFHDSERRFADIIDFLPDPTFVTDREGTVIAWNRAIEEMTGVSAKDMLGKGNYEYAIPLYGSRRPVLIDLIDSPEEKIQQLYTNVSLTATSLTAESDLPRPDGHQLHVLAKVCHLFNKEGEITGTIESIRDITDRKQAEVSLKKSEAFLTSVFEQSPNPMWISDQDGNLIRVNPACKDLLQLSDEDLVGKYNIFRDNIVEEQGFMPLVRRVYERGEPVSFPLVYDSAMLKGLVLPHTVKRTLAITIFPVRDPDGNVTNAVIQPQDVTEWQQTEEALRESESRYRELADLLPQMVFELDPDFQVTYANQHTLSVFGFTEKDIKKGINGLSFIDPSQHGRVRENSRTLSEGSVSYECEEYTAVRADGSRFPALVYSTPIFRENRLFGFRGVIVDITAGKKLEEELRESERTFRTIFDCNPYPITINSTPGNTFLDVNRAFLDASGYSEADLIGKNPIELGMISFSDAARLIARQGSGGKIENVQLALNVKEGRKIHVLVSTMPVIIKKRPAVVTIVAEITKLKRIEQELLQKNEELNAACNGLTAADEQLRQNIDELTRTELELRRSEEKFRSLIEHSLDGIVIVDFSGNILFLNREARRIVDEPGYQTLVGKKNVMDYVDRVSKPDVRRDLSRVTGGDEAHLVTYKISTGSGREIWVECVGSRIIFGESGAVLISMRDVTERKKVEDAVRESENRFTTVFQKSPISLTLVAAGNGRFADINEEFLRKTGYSRDEVIGRTAQELGLFADLNEYQRFTALLKEQKTVHGMEIKCRAKSGEVNACRFSSGVIEMAGKPHILSTVEDITEWKMAKYAIEAIVRSLVGTTGAGALWKIAENINSWLGADCVMVGEIQPDGLTVKTVSMLLDGKEVPDFSYPLKGTPCEEASEKGFCLYPDNVSQIFPGNQDLVDLHIRGYVGVPLRESRGYVIGILCVLSRTPLHYTHTIREIMEVIAAKAAVELERIRIERDLMESRQMLAEAMDLAKLVNWEYDFATGMFTFNDHFYAIYGTTKEREGGCRMSAETYAREFIPPEERELVIEEERKALETTDPCYTSQREHRIIRRDGEIRHIVVHIGITKDKDGKTIKAHGANQDITDRKRVEESLRLANRQLGLLSGITRHDILNKTSVILGFLAIAKKKWNDPALQDILRKTEAATWTIQSQIEFTRTYQNLGTHAPKWLDLGAIMFLMQVPARISLVTNVQGISVFADPMFEMVFTNLLDNSIRHGEHVSRIRVSADRSGDRLVLVWEDNGIGIADDEKERIFDRGFGKHTGLGMFLAREILALTGITIRETGVRGQGVRFEITIPKGQYRCLPQTRTTF